MPARHSVKTYLPQSYYHLYNRGVEKRDIFLDDQDHGVLLSYLKTYLQPKDEQGLLFRISNTEISWKEREKAMQELRLNNFHNEIVLMSFCFMPNHYHMELKQITDIAIDVFMNSLWTRYSMYFNKKYKRVGPLFQDVYKAVLIQSNEQLLHLSRYIHRNPIAKRMFRSPLSKREALMSYPFSSYLDYLGMKHTDWIHPEEIVGLLGIHESYQSFVENYDDIDSARVIAPVMIDI